MTKRIYDPGHTKNIGNDVNQKLTIQTSLCVTHQIVIACMSSVREGVAHHQNTDSKCQTENGTPICRHFRFRSKRQTCIL